MGKPRILSNEEIVRAAISLVDRGGSKALGMRPLAAKLGVATMTLYTYVKDRGELIDAMILEILRDLPSTDTSRDWRVVQRMRTLRFRKHALAHPKVFILCTERLVSHALAGTLEHTDWFYSALKAEGFSRQEAMSAGRVLQMFVTGWLMFEGMSFRRAKRERSRRDAEFTLALDAILDRLRPGSIRP